MCTLSAYKNSITWLWVCQLTEYAQAVKGWFPARGAFQPWMMPERQPVSYGVGYFMKTRTASVCVYCLIQRNKRLLLNTHAGKKRSRLLPPCDIQAPHMSLLNINITPHRPFWRTKGGSAFVSAGHKGLFCLCKTDLFPAWLFTKAQYITWTFHCYFI